MKNIFRLFMRISVFVPYLHVQAQLSISTLNIPYLTDFNAFAGNGFSPTPSSGQLDSDTWAIYGLSDGDINFGGSGNTGDFARGISSGSVSPGGVYAFDHGNSDYMFGIQPTSSDFTPGYILLKIQNSSGQTIQNLDISYEIWSYNDGNRGNSIYLYSSYDNINYVRIPALDYVSVAPADTPAVWDSVIANVMLTGLSIPDNNFFYLKWLSDDSLGTGFRDEIGLDDVRITAGNQSVTAEFVADDICLGDTAYFFDSSSTNNGNIINWYWDFGDSSGTSNLQNPWYFYNDTGTYTVMLIVTNSNNETDTVFHTLTVHPLPVAGFSYTTNGLNVIFTDASQGASSWFWDFGDLTTDNTQNPSHTYGSQGTYTVWLVVTSSFGCKDSISDTVTVLSTGTALFSPDHISIFPNPVLKGRLYLDFGKHHPLCTSIRIFDLVGNQLFEEVIRDFPDSRFVLDLTAFAEGNYFILIQNNEWALTRKITIKK